MGFAETHTRTLWEQHVPSHARHLFTPKRLHLNTRQGGCEAPKCKGGEFGEEELKAAGVERGRSDGGNVKMSLQKPPG